MQEVEHDHDKISLGSLGSKPTVVSPGSSMRRRSIAPSFETEETLKDDPSDNLSAERKTHSTRNLEVVIVGADILLLLAPCIFLYLAVQALAVDHRPVSDKRGLVVEKVAKLGPSVFPVIFAAICGRLMRTYALWRAERGATLGIIEQLNGSQNLLSAFERAVMLPGLGMLSLSVVTLWALSPIGGQSSLRILGRGSSEASNQTTVYYFNTSGNGNDGAFAGSIGYTEFSPSLNAMFRATMTSIKKSGQDSWGNVRVPALHYVATFARNEIRHGWYDFDEPTYNEPYTALSGIVVSGLMEATDTSFTMESSYFNLTCSDPVYFDTSETEVLTQLMDWVSPLRYHINSSQLFMDGRGRQYSYFVDTNYNHTQLSDSLPRYNIIYGSQYGDNTYYKSYVVYNCTVNTMHVETGVLCHDSSCHVRRIRPSQKVLNTNTGFPFPIGGLIDPCFLLSWMGTATGSTLTGSVTPIDYYIFGSDTPYDRRQDISYSNVSGAALAKRLQSLMNTGWQLSFQGSATAQKPATNMAALRCSTNALRHDSCGDDGVGYAVIAANATTISTCEVFVADKGWVALTTIISLILLSCGVASLIFTYTTRSPDVLGYVSSMTMDNPNFGPIVRSGRLDGLQRSKRLRHVRVQLTDAETWDGQGHITLKNLGHEHRESNILQRLSRKVHKHASVPSF